MQPVPLGQPNQVTQSISYNLNASSTLPQANEDKHTKFLSTIGGLDRAFKIPSTIYKLDNSTVDLDKKYTQADQGFDLNMISAGLAWILCLILHLLEEVGFKGLTMRTADHHETLLRYWVWLKIAVQGIVRDIRCFVAPELQQTGINGAVEYLSLILGLPWLYSVDAIIFIRQSKILIGDTSIGETVREVIGSELVFCRDYNLLLYLKAAMARPAQVEEVSELGSSSPDSDGSDDISDVGGTQLFR